MKNKVGIDKREFDARVKAILEQSKANRAALEGLLALGTYDRIIDDLGAHDPELARLTRAVDLSAIGPLDELIRYVSQRVEN